MKKLLSLFMFLAPAAFGAVHIQQGDDATLANVTATGVTASSVTVTGAGIRFPDGTVQVSSAPAGVNETNAIVLQSTLQSNSTFYTSSGTVNSFNASTITTNNTAPGIRFVESDQSGPIGNYRLMVDADIFNIMGRNAANTGDTVMVSATRSNSSFGPLFTLAADGAATMALRFRANSSTGKYTEFISSPTISGSNRYYLPPSSGTAGQAILTDGANNLYFGSVAASAGGSGLVNAATINYIPRYSVTGSSNVLSGSPGISVTTITATGLVALSTFTASSATIVALNVNGAGGGELDLTEGDIPSGIVDKAVIYADAGTHWPGFIPNGESHPYFMMGSSITPTIGNCVKFSGIGGSLLDAGAPCGTGSGSGSGSGSGVVNAGTQNYVPYYSVSGSSNVLSGSPGISVSTLTVSSTTFLAGATFYYNGGIKLGGTYGNPSSMYLNSGNDLSTGGNVIMIGSPNSTTTGANLTTGSSGVCIGGLSCEGMTINTNFTAVGYKTLKVSNGGLNNTAIGANNLSNSVSGNQNTCVGSAACDTNVSGSNLTALGYQACHNTIGTSSSTLVAGVCIGYGSYVDTSHTMAIGSPAVWIDDVYMNSKSQTASANGSSVTFHAQASSGTDNMGGNFTIASGQSTGAGAGSSVFIKTPRSETTGTTVNSLVTVASFSVSGMTISTVTAANVVVVSTGPANALSVTANGGDYGTTNGTSGGFLVSCPGGSTQGECAQVYSNAGAQSNLTGVLNVVADNTAWNTVTLYVQAAGSDPENGIRVDGNDYSTLVLNDTKLSGGAASQNGKYQFSSHNNQLRGERRNAANNAFESAWVVANTTITSGGVMMITTGYENPASTLAVNGNLIVGDGYAGATTGGSAARNGMLVQGAVDLKSSMTVVGNASFQGTVTISSALVSGLNVTAISANYTATSTDTIISASATNSTTTVTLDAASTLKGQSLSIFKTDTSSSPVIVTCAGSDKINGSTGTFRLNAQGQTIQIVSDGTSSWLARSLQATPIGIPPMSFDETANSAAQTSSTTLLTAIYVPTPVRVTGCRFVPNIQSGNVDCGIYDTNGTLLSSSTITAEASVGSLQTFNFISAVNLSPGMYYVAIGLNNATGTFKGYSCPYNCSTVSANFPLATGISVPGTAFTIGSAFPGVQLIVTGGASL